MTIFRTIVIKLEFIIELINTAGTNKIDVVTFDISHQIFNFIKNHE